MKRPSALPLWLALLLSACVPPAAKPADQARLKVVASIFPLSEFARAVAGDRAEVSLLLPPGAEIHTWQPSARQILRLGQARLFIYVGAHLEPWAQEVVRSQAKSGLKVLEASRGVALVQNDPHIWLDFDQDIRLVARIRSALTELDPGSADAYKKNADSYADGLRRLDLRYRAVLGSCKQRTLVLGGHAAFGYLAARYGLSQVSLYGLSPDSEPTPKHLLEVARRVKEQKIAAVFFESTVNPKLARLLARETGAEALPLNDGANISPAQFAAGLTFLNIMEDNLKSLEHGLRCR
jgi:zinc transport system substrate-binding protein